VKTNEDEKEFKRFEEHSHTVVSLSVGLFLTLASALPGPCFLLTNPAELGSAMRSLTDWQTGAYTSSLPNNEQRDCIEPRDPRQEHSLALHYVALQCLAQQNLKSGYPNWNIW
jgi:hypothetical protein